MEVSAYVNGPYEGVSQAPSQVRLAGACEIMEDCYANLPHGIQKRPPFEWAAQVIPSGGLPTALFASIPRGSPGADVTLVINQEGGHNVPRLFLTSDWSPIALTIDPAAQTYLDALSAAPHADLRTLSVEDVTFILNRKVPTADLGTTQALRPFEALIWAKLGNYGRKFSITVTGSFGSITSSYTTATGGDSNDPLTVDTAGIMGVLLTGTRINPGHDVYAGTPLNTLTGSGFTVTQLGSILYLSHPTNDFTLAVVDGQGQTAMEPIKTSVQRVSDLPEVGVDGFVIRVQQESVGGNSDYYLQFHADNSSTGGYWKECLAPGAALGLDPSTMPVAIKDTAGVWTLVPLAWTGRTTGDAALSPDPDFLTEPLQAIKWWKGRLAVVSPGSLTFSASDSPFKFYTTTLSVGLDSDPIGLLPPDAQQPYFRDAIQFDQRFVTLGDLSQGIVSAASKVITPATTGMDPLSSVSYTDQVPAFGVNHKVYFASFHGAYAAIHEVAIDRLSGLAIPQVMTPAVPAYIPSTIDRAASYDTEYTAWYGSSGSARMFVHCFRETDQNERVQNAWHAWNLPTGYTLAGLYIRSSTMYLLGLNVATGALEILTADLVPDPGLITSDPPAPPSPGGFGQLDYSDPDQTIWSEVV